MTDIEQDVMNDVPGVHLFAKLGLSIESLTAEIKKNNDREQGRLARLPNYQAFEQATQPGDVTRIIDFGTPQAGRVWIVRLLVAVASGLATNAAVVTWYVGQSVGAAAGLAAGTLPPNWVRWQFPSVPGFQNFTSDVFKVLPNQHLFAGVTAIAGGTVINTIAMANDQPLYAQSGPVAVE